MCEVSLGKNMVQSVTLSKISSNVAKTFQKSGSCSNIVKVLLPLVWSLSLGFATINDKRVEKPENNQMGSVDLETLEYSAWARLNDLRAHKEVIDYPINSKDSNKWNQIFRN